MFQIHKYVLWGWKNTFSQSTRHVEPKCFKHFWWISKALICISLVNRYLHSNVPNPIQPVCIVLNATHTIQQLEDSYLHISPTGAVQPWKPTLWSSRCSVCADVNVREGPDLCNHGVNRVMVTLNPSALSNPLCNFMRSAISWWSFCCSQILPLQ